MDSQLSKRVAARLTPQLRRRAAAFGRQPRAALCGAGCSARRPASSGGGQRCGVPAHPWGWRRRGARGLAGGQPACITLRAAVATVEAAACMLWHKVRACMLSSSLERQKSYTPALRAQARAHAGTARAAGRQPAQPPGVAPRRPGCRRGAQGSPARSAWAHCKAGQEMGGRGGASLCEALCVVLQSLLGLAACSRPAFTILHHTAPQRGELQLHAPLAAVPARLELQGAVVQVASSIRPATVVLKLGPCMPGRPAQVGDSQPIVHW